MWINLLFVPFILSLLWISVPPLSERPCAHDNCWGAASMHPATLGGDMQYMVTSAFFLHSFCGVFFCCFFCAGYCFVKLCRLSSLSSYGLLWVTIFTLGTALKHWTHRRICHLLCLCYFSKYVWCSSLCDGEVTLETCIQTEGPRRTLIVCDNTRCQWVTGWVPPLYVYYFSLDACLC